MRGDTVKGVGLVCIGRGGDSSVAIPLMGGPGVANASETIDR